MQKHSTEFYHAAIKSAYPDCTNIRTPKITGWVSPIFIADTNTDTIVCKFNDANMVARNHIVSSVLTAANIPVPYTRTHKFLDSDFESYVYCPDKTLYEHMQSGLTDEQIFNAYQQALRIQKYITQIAPNDLGLQWGQYAHETFRANQQMVLPPLLGRVHSVMYKALSYHDKMCLLHNDMQPKNMLLDGTKNLTQLIDLDMIAVANVNFSVMQMLRAYPLNNREELLECCSDILEIKLNKDAIRTGISILNHLRDYKLKLTQLCWRGYQQPLPRR